MPGKKKPAASFWYDAARAFGADRVRPRRLRRRVGSLRAGERFFELAAAVDAFPTYFIVEAATMKILRRTIVTQVAQPLGPTLDQLLAGT